MDIIKQIVSVFIFLFFVLCTASISAQNSGVKVGAYYFDGWTGTYDYHITKKLKNDFDNRTPIWGWITSTQHKVDEQIVLAQQSGLSFLSFCWYYQNIENPSLNPMNQALNYFKASSKKKNLSYSLLVVNQQKSGIDPNAWSSLSKNWIEEFKNANYLFIENKPLLIFYSVKSLVQEFGSPLEVKKAFEDLRNNAIRSGFDGVTIAACILPDSTDMKLANECTFDLFTGYNYHEAGLAGSSKSVPIEKLQIAERKIWNKFIDASKPYIPSVTLNWDPRPWSTAKNNYDALPYYTGFSPLTAAASINGAIKWVSDNPRSTTKDKLIIVYAWNEYGEGAYMTPSKGFKNNILEVIKPVLLKHK